MRGFILVLLSIFLLIPDVQAQESGPYSALVTGGKGGWLNTTRPLTEADFKGRAVLLDFWTYGCVNCMQIIPDLEYLEGKFGTKLLIVGVHSAKFQGEQGNERILFAAKRFGLKHPVINDSDYAIWDSYHVKAWPTQVLLGPDGEEVARYSGEGHRDLIEKDIAALDITASMPAAPVAKAIDKSVLSFPARMAINGQNFTIADSGHNRILVTDKTGKILFTAGSGVKGFKDGALASAQFNQPRGFTVLGDKIYVADTGNHALRLIDLSTQLVSTLAGTGVRGFGELKDKSNALKVALASPWAVAALDDHMLVIAMAGVHQLWGYDIGTMTLSRLAGSGREAIKDGAALEADLAQPSALSVVDGTIYFADAESSALRMLKDGQVKTLIGTGLFDFGLKDGKYPEARLQHPQGIYATADKIYIADTYNNVVRVYDLKTGVLSTLAIASKLSEPGDVVLEGESLYIVDTNADAIHKIDLKTGKAGDFSLSP